MAIQGCRGNENPKTAGCVAPAGSPKSVSTACWRGLAASALVGANGSTPCPQIPDSAANQLPQGHPRRRKPSPKELDAIAVVCATHSGSCCWSRCWAWISGVGDPMPPSSTHTAARKPDGSNKAHLQSFGDVLQAWMITQTPGGAEGLEHLICDERRCEALRLRPNRGVTDLSPR